MKFLTSTTNSNFILYYIIIHCVYTNYNPVCYLKMSNNIFGCIFIIFLQLSRRWRFPNQYTRLWLRNARLLQDGILFIVIFYSESHHMLYSLFIPNKYIIVYIYFLSYIIIHILFIFSIVIVFNKNNFYFNYNVLALTW